MYLRSVGTRVTLSAPCQRLRQATGLAASERHRQCLLQWQTQDGSESGGNLGQEATWSRCDGPWSAPSSARPGTNPECHVHPVALARAARAAPRPPRGSARTRQSHLLAKTAHAARCAQPRACKGQQRCVWAAPLGVHARDPGRQCGARAQRADRSAHQHGLRQPRVLARAAGQPPGSSGSKRSAAAGAASAAAAAAVGASRTPVSVGQNGARVQPCEGAERARVRSCDRRATAKLDAGATRLRTRSRSAPRRARREPGGARAAASGVPAARKKASLDASRPMAQSPQSTSASGARGGGLPARRSVLRWLALLREA